MRSLAVLTTVLCGCNAVFGLEQPRRSDAIADAAAPSKDAADRDAAVDAPRPDAIGPDASLCGPEFVTLGGSTTTYYHVVTATTWTLAEADCESRNAHLVVPGSASESQTLAVALGGVSVWLGMSDRRNEGTYRWVTDEDTGAYPPATGLPWATNQPNGLDTTDCIVYFGDASPFGWHDRDCALTHGYLCECDGYAANPANY